MNSLDIKIKITCLTFLYKIFNSYINCRNYLIVVILMTLIVKLELRKVYNFQKPNHVFIVPIKRLMVLAYDV